MNVEPLVAAVEACGLVTGGTGSVVRPIVPCKGSVCVHGLADTQAFADRIYNVTGSGIADLKLAEKIFASDADTDFTEEEAARIRKHAEGSLPWFIAGLEYELEKK